MDALKCQHLKKLVFLSDLLPLLCMETQAPRETCELRKMFPAWVAKRTASLLL